MEESLDVRILDVLYCYFEHHAGDPQMPLGKLHDALGVSSDEEREVRKRLYILKKKEWIDCQLLDNGSGGTVAILPAGIKVVEDRRKNPPYLTDGRRCS